MIFIWIRATVDWADEAAFVAQMPAELPAKVALWNETFTLPYHLFRLRVREIAAESLARVEGAVCAEWDEIPDGAVFLPVDDDDWFSPDAARALEAALEPGVDAYVWSGRWLEIPMNLGHRVYLARRRLFPWTWERWLLATNNHALVKRSSFEPRLVENHARTDRWFKGEQRQGRVRLKRLDGCLSVTNRTFASRTALLWDKPSIGRAELLRKYRGYRVRYDRPVAPEVAWSEPYQRAMAELMRELELRPGVA